MKFYQDSGFKWTAASTLVLASIFSMMSFGASAGAPIANPPGGNISPTFTNLTTATDVIVGKNLRIGDSIVPNSGKSFALSADKVNFTKDIEVAGDGIINKVLHVVGSITGKDPLTPLLLNGNTNVKGNLNISDGLQAGITINSNTILQKQPGEWIHLGDNLGRVDVPGDFNASGKTNLGAIDAVSLKLSSILRVAGLANFVNIWSSGDVMANKYTVAKVTAGGLEGNFGGLSIDEAGKSIQLYSNKPNSDHVRIEGLDFSSTILPYSATIAYKAPGAPPLKIDAPLNVTGHFKAATIGGYNQLSLLANNGGNSVPVAPGKVGAVSSLNCPSKTQEMISCSLFSYQTTLTASAIISSSAGWGTDWNCSVTAQNNGTKNAVYSAQAVCFDPNE